MTASWYQDLCKDMGVEKYMELINNLNERFSDIDPILDEVRTWEG